MVTTDEVDTFHLLKPALRHDLVTTHGFSQPEAGQILNWFDPSNTAYLEHVDAWQKLLCSGASPTQDFPLARRNVWGSYDIWHLPAHAVGAIHQVAKLMYKWHGVPRRETNMLEVYNRLSEPLPITAADFELEGIRKCLAGIVPPDLNQVIGRFGPGATCERFSAYTKWRRQGAIPDVPPSMFRVNSRDPWSPTLVDDEGLTRIAEVPKSIKCNRIVSSEPAMRMYAQEAVARDLDDQMHRLFRGHVYLHDQEQHNERLLWRDACSVDLSDASDHVSCPLVQAVLPQLWPVLAKVRSQFSLFPDGRVARLATFAPMGSGVCFNVMTLVILGMCEFLAREVRAEDKRTRVWYVVYGDDIIVPICMYDRLLDLITRCGLVPNRAKSCCTTIYRESCGREMYYNLDITPGYIRDPLLTVDASKIESVCVTLMANGFDSTAALVAKSSECISYTEYNSDLQRLEVCVRTTSVRQKVKSLDGYDGLNRWFALHTQQECCITPNGAKGRPSSAACEVWTRPAWRLRAEEDYPYLTTWLVTRLRPKPEETPRK